MDRPEWIIPVKCNSLRWFYNAVKNLNYCLFAVYCILSPIYFILMWFHIVEAELILFMISYFGSGALIAVGAIVIGENWQKIICYIPQIKCIED